MLSSIDGQPAPENTREVSLPIRRHRHTDRKRDRQPHPPPPSHPAATAEVGQLLDLGLALGHERFELVSLVGREEAGRIAAHAWADCGDSETRRDSGRQAHMHLDDTMRSRPRPATPSRDRAQAGREELRREVEWLRERIDNLSRELVLARKDSGRLARQLKQEEEVGREQRRRADDAVREAKALRKELNGLKKDRTVDGAAARAALSDAQSRSVRMAERRRRQQAESLMQAYKGLYEDQLQTQHASAESYRSLTRGYSRLSADNEALRRETATVAAVAAAAGDAAGNAAALISSSAKMQRTAAAARPAKEERRDPARGSRGRGSGSGVVAESGGAAVTPAESAAAVATAASAVAAAAGALAEATSPALPTDGQGSAALTRPSVDKGEGESVVVVGGGGGGGGAAAATAVAAAATRIYERSGIAAGKSSSRYRPEASGYGSVGNERPSTAETLACSPYSDRGDAPPSTTTREPATAAADKNSGTAGTETGGAAAALVGDQAPPADCSLARRETTSRTAARARSDTGDGGRTTKSYAFPQTAEEGGEHRLSLPGIRASSAASAAAAAAAAAAASQKPQDGGSPHTRRGLGAPEPDEHEHGGGGAGTEAEEPPRLTKAVPPVEPAPRWRGRSADSGRLLASSASWAENVHVEAPKRSSSPAPPRRGRWGERAPDGGWGGGDGGGGEGGARGDGCSRIEPSSRLRPHSI